MIVAASDAATLLLRGLGLLADPATAVGSKALSGRVEQIVEDLGFVQVDSICTLERAHHLILHARLDAYRPEALRTLLERRRSLFEQWTHDASVIPVRWYPHWHHRFRRSAVRIRQNRWWRERMGRRDRITVSRVRDFVAERGPTAAREVVFDDLRPKGVAPSSAWWGWRPEKAALEFLWRTGELAISARDNFEKVYDLAERVHPAHHPLPMPSRAEHVDWSCSSALARLGVATARELAEFWRGIESVEAQRWCDGAVRTGAAVAVIRRDLDGREVAAVARPDWRETVASAPPPPDRLRALCPFDPLVRDRDRLRRLFGFEYRFEAFVPRAKRQYGYYTLPLMDMERGRVRFVGRLDARHDRAARALVVEGLWWEPGVRPTKARRDRLDDALVRIAALVGAERVVGFE